MPAPPVLLEPKFSPLWQHVSTTLDRRGLSDRGWIRLPDGLPAAVRARLKERVPGPSTTRLDLAALERSLAHHGCDLLTLLADAGFAPAGRREVRDAERDRRRSRDEALLAAAREELGRRPAYTPGSERCARGFPTTRPRTGWSGWWRGSWSSPARPASAAGPRSRRRRSAAPTTSTSRQCVPAARRPRPRAACGYRHGDVGHWDDPEVWDAAGLPGDLVATPVLTWALPLLGGGLGAAVRAATAAGAPMPLTAFSLREMPLEVPPDTVVRSVENPRLLEAAR
jgi:hypothetical protein